MLIANEPSDVTGMYEVLFNTENDTAPVRVLEGTFKDFVYKYGAIQVGEFEGDPSDVPLKYEYTLLFTNSFLTIYNLKYLPTKYK